MTPSVGAVVPLAALLSLACGPGPPTPALELPARPVGAPGGAEVARAVRSLALDAREDRLFAEIARGNVPSWLRTLERVEISGQVRGREHRVTFWTTPDYLAVGSGSDHVLVPLTPRTAQRVADRLDASLPTPKMVDAIWEHARTRLAPIRIPPDEHMRSVRYFERHHNLVAAQRWLKGVPEGSFVAGHKKDVVLSPRLSRNAGKVAIYGWHHAGGEPLQPVNTVLSDRAVVYNHGVRLVHRVVLVDGTRRKLAAVLGDPALAPLLSEEGVISPARYPTAPSGR